MKYAVIVVDMLKDNIKEDSTSHAVLQARSIIPAINALTGEARRRRFPVVFAGDSFLPGDFIFRGKMKEHALRGTEGASVADELHREAGDIILPKRRFSAFFKTDLDQTLRMQGVEGVAIGGINSHWCVLDTAFDALSLDFSALIVSDCSASYSAEAHGAFMKLYGKSPLYPLFRIMTLEEFKGELSRGGVDGRPAL